MYYRWKDGRVIVKTTIWGAVEDDARQTLQHLAAHVRAQTTALETSQPEADQSVGIVRNGPVRQIAEPDREFSLFFCHLPGDRSEFRGQPVDYKCVAPHAPVQGNRAFDTAVESTDGVLLVIDGSPDGLEKARHALDGLAERLSERYTDDPVELFGSDGPVSLVVLDVAPPENTNEHAGVRSSLGLPSSVHVIEQNHAEPLESAARAFYALTDAIAPRLEEAAESGRLPV